MQERMGRGMIRVKQKDIGLTTEIISQRIGPGRRLTQLAGREGRGVHDFYFDGSCKGHEGWPEVEFMNVQFP